MENKSNQYVFSEESGEISFLGYYPNFFTEKETQLLLKNMTEMQDWRSDEEGFLKTPRLQKWYHRQMLPFASTWHKQYPRWQPFEYSEFLNELEKTVIQRFKSRCILPTDKSINSQPNFNSVLINYYRDHQDSIRKHRDSQPEFGNNPTILGFSLGATRDILFERIQYDPNKLSSIKLKKEPPISISLESGSLLVMAGATQKYFCHSLPKCDNALARYSFTFREHKKIIN